MKKQTVILIAVIFVMAGCADTVNVNECISSAPYGFWSGLWHGLICPISFIGSLFSDDIAVYAMNNTGGWYDFGFLLGAGSSLAGSSRSIKSK